MVLSRMAFCCLAGLVLPAGAWAQQRCEADGSLRSMPTARFQDNGDGTVTDQQSQLMWMRCSAGQQARGAACDGDAQRLTWAAAGMLADEVNRRGQFFYNDWRVPSVRDLATITERHCSDPRVNLTVFPSTVAAFYWTSSARPAPGAESQAYALSFGPDGVVLASKEELNHVRLVRTGP